MSTDGKGLERLASLLQTRNTIELEIARILGRPVTHGHLGEHVASDIFGIQLEESASAKGVDGRFTSGPLAGRTVDIKWYGKREGLVDLAAHDAPPAYYLVMTGPKSPAASSRGSVRPWCIESVYLFETATLFARLRERGVKIGVATSVAAAFWAEAEIYPETQNSAFLVTDEMRAAIALFAPVGYSS